MVGPNVKRVRALHRLTKTQHIIYADGKGTHAGPPDSVVCVPCLAREALGYVPVKGATRYFDNEGNLRASS